MKNWLCEMLSSALPNRIPFLHLSLCLERMEQFSGPLDSLIFTTIIHMIQCGETKFPHDRVRRRKKKGKFLAYRKKNGLRK
jgi:hypothetical protein